MANELKVIGFTTGEVVYATLWRNDDQYVYSTVAVGFVPYVDANWAHYVLTMTEASRVWTGSLPTGLDKNYVLTVSYYHAISGTPAVTNRSIGSERIDLLKDSPWRL